MKELHETISRLKCAGQVMDFPALPCDADLNDIKTTETTVEMSLPQEPARRLDDFLLFPVIDSGRWPTEAPRAPRLDFNEGHGLPSAGHDVDFPARRAKMRARIS